MIYLTVRATQTVASTKSLFFRIFIFKCNISHNKWYHLKSIHDQPMNKGPEKETKKNRYLRANVLYHSLR